MVTLLLSVPTVERESLLAYMQEKTRQHEKCTTFPFTLVFFAVFTAVLIFHEDTFVLSSLAKKYVFLTSKGFEPCVVRQNPGSKCQRDCQRNWPGAARRSPRQRCRELATDPTLQIIWSWRFRSGGAKFELQIWS